MRHAFTLLLLLLGLLAAAGAQAVPTWGAPASSPASTPPSALKPGEWIWGGGDQGAGPLAIVVSLDEQRAYVYRNGLLVAVSTVSTGKPGHETPTGVFTILQKDRDHHSNKYGNAPMPYQERLTWDGVALHAGGLPGYPESHGCIHMPTAFAKRLFDATTLGMTVVVARGGVSPDAQVHPTAVSPIDPHDGHDAALPALAHGEPWRWQPEAAPEGPVSLVLATADRRLLVLRNGIEIGRSQVEVAAPGPRAGTHAYVVAAGDAQAATPRWLRVGIPGDDADAGQPVADTDVARVQVPAAFRALLQPLLVPGTVLLETDQHVLPTTTGSPVRVIDSDPPTL